MLIFAKLPSGIRGTRRPEGAFCTHCASRTPVYPHMGGALLPLSICPHLGPETHRCLLSFSLLACPSGIIFIHHENGFGQVGQRPELGAGMNLGGGACQEARAPAGRVNTIKLLLLSRQPGLEVGEQEGTEPLAY